MESIREALSYIHSHYAEPITIADVAARAYLSPSYFSVVFRALTGYTVKDYITRFRLRCAARALAHTSRPVVAIAYEHGFSSQQAFTRSFTQAYGSGPARFRREGRIPQPFPPEHFMQEGWIHMDYRKVFDNVRYEKKDAFLVVGIETDVDYNIPAGYDGISRLYDRWGREHLIDLIPDQTYSGLTYGMTHESTEEDRAKYLVAVEVRSLNNLPAGFVARRFDAGEYAVFTTTLKHEASGEFFRYFYGTWLKEMGYKQPDEVITRKNNLFTRYPQYEVYDSSFVDESSQIQIYCPILR